MILTEVFMIKKFVAKPLWCIFLGGAFLSATPGYQDSNSDALRGVKPGVSDDSSQSQRTNDQQSGREQLAQQYPRNYRYHDAYEPSWDWDYKEGWRYDREAYFRGETQAEAYRRHHPYGPGGIGYDPAEGYERNLERIMHEKNSKGAGNSQYSNSRQNDNQLAERNSLNHQAYSNSNQGRSNQAYGRDNPINNANYYNSGNNNIGYYNQGYYNNSNVSDYYDNYQYRQPQGGYQNPQGYPYYR